VTIVEPLVPVEIGMMESDAVDPFRLAEVTPTSVGSATLKPSDANEPDERVTVMGTGVVDPAANATDAGAALIVTGAVVGELVVPLLPPHAAKSEAEAIVMAKSGRAVIGVSAGVDARDASA
jgi:hypothetical protein